LLRQRAAPRHAERIDGTAITELVEQPVGKPREPREAVRMRGKRRGAHPRHVEQHDFDVLEGACERPEHLERRPQLVECDQRRRTGAAALHGHPQALVADADQRTSRPVESSMTRRSSGVGQPS
jgi:hypothetical protein